MAIRLVVFAREVVETMLAISREVHPNEMMVMLRGRKREDEIYVDEVLFPPESTFGEGFSELAIHNLPIDLSIVGSAHSHPSGNVQPSTQDLNHFFGRIMVILASPYSDYEDLRVYNSDGKTIPFATK